MKNRGFTLIELIVTMAIVAIVATMAVPSYLTFIQNNRLAAQSNALITSLNIARSESVKRLASTVANPNPRVTVCASSNGTACSNANQWELGWIVFVDLNADGVVNPGTGACLATEDCILQVAGLLQGGNTLRSSGFANLFNVQYNTRGALNSAGTFTLCDKRGVTNARAINLNLTGRASQRTAVSCP